MGKAKYCPRSTPVLHNFVNPAGCLKRIMFLGDFVPVLHLSKGLSFGDGGGLSESIMSRGLCSGRFSQM